MLGEITKLVVLKNDGTTRLGDYWNWGPIVETQEVIVKSNSAEGIFVFYNHVYSVEVQHNAGLINTFGQIR